MCASHPLAWSAPRHTATRCRVARHATRNSAGATKRSPQRRSTAAGLSAGDRQVRPAPPTQALRRFDPMPGGVRPKFLGLIACGPRRERAGQVDRRGCSHEAAGCAAGAGIENVLVEPLFHPVPYSSHAVRDGRTGVVRPATCRSAMWVSVSSNTWVELTVSARSVTSPTPLTGCVQDASGPELATESASTRAAQPLTLRTWHCLPSPAKRYGRCRR